MFLNNLVFLRFMLVLNGLKSSGRPVGTISTYFRQKRSGGFRAMTKKPKKLTSIKLTHWLICYFQLFGKRFREVFWSFLTCFPDSFRSIFRIQIREKILENPYWSYTSLFNSPNNSRINRWARWHSQFFMQNPNLQSKLTESSVQGPKFRKTKI